MFRASFTLLKASLFCLSILVLGSIIRWDGLSLSDRIERGVEIVTRTKGFLNMKAWSSRVVKTTAQNLHLSERDEILSSERKKLQMLIEEINSDETTTANLE